MKNLVCNINGEIYYANVKKDGKMSEKDRVNLTKEAPFCTAIHLMMSDEYKKNDGFSGYTYETTDGGKVTLAAYDESKFMIIRRPDADVPVEETDEPAETSDNVVPLFPDNNGTEEV